MKRNRLFRWRRLLAAVAICLAVFGLGLEGGPAKENTGLSSVRPAAAVNTTAARGDEVSAEVGQSPDRPTPAKPAATMDRLRSTDSKTVAEFSDDGVRHVGRVVSSTAVASAGGGGSSRAAGILGLGEPCSCDEDCDGSLGDQCNLVQCIVRGVCTGDNQTPCRATGAGGSADADCDIVGGVCDAGSFVQRCDLGQLVGWSCDATPDNGFCEEDRCEDDGSGSEHSICAEQTEGVSALPLSPCAKRCVGGAADGLRCDRSSECPQGSCTIEPGGQCDETADVCYVGSPGDLSSAIGRCCTAGTCTETVEAICTGGGGVWLRYTDPGQQVGDGNCICPKYGSGVAPSDADTGSVGSVRPSGLVCQVGSRASVEAGGTPVYCEDLDGNGLSPQFCLRRCLGGELAGELCEADNPDCAFVGACSSGSANCLGGANDGNPCNTLADCPEGVICLGDFFCLVAEGGADCPSGSACVGGANDGLVCFDDTNCPDGVCTAIETCNPTDPGVCTNDPCVSNAIEDGCEDGYLQVGDDYALSNGSYLRLTQFRFRGGVTNQDEDIVFEFWDSTGTHLVDSFEVNDLDPTGTRDWTIEVDCWPNCDPNRQEVPQPKPIIIPPNGFVVMRSVRTVGTIDGAAAYWSQTDGVDVGVNNSALMWINGDPVDGTTVDASYSNVLIFELVGVKVPDPLGACCDDSASCTNTLRWECGLCSPDATQPCASTLHDCPDGGLTGSVCQFNRWFGPTSHADFEFGGADLTLCNGVAPCNLGACCQGSDCTVTEEGNCPDAPNNWLGPATDCTPNCCPVANPTGVDCICETWTCVRDVDIFNTALVCDPANGNGDCELDHTCTFQCAPDPGNITLLRHPYECYDNFPSPLIPAVACDPANGDADCNVGLGETCQQSFDLSVTTSRTDTIVSTFGALQGDGCSLNTNTDRVGWFERFTLVDPTPGDETDDCFIVTVSMCCTEPVLTPIWAFLSQFTHCPCTEMADVAGIAPDFNVDNNLKAGFGPSSLANVPCSDENWAGTWTVPPGVYAYQVRASKFCAGTSPAQWCISDDDCEGVSCELATPDYTLHFTVESCNLGACCINETCIVTNKLDCVAQEGNFLGDGDQPVNTCQTGSCNLGSCCLVGQCRDDSAADTFAECEAQGGVYQGGVLCESAACPLCPFAGSASCQEVQTTFGMVPSIDRNPANGPFGETASVLADDVRFGGDVVDKICWNTGFYQTPCCPTSCVQSIDDTWEIRVYDTDPGCPGIPGVEIGASTITVLNKLEGTGSGTGTWHYGGVLDTPIALPNGGFSGDTYWFEVSGFGEPGCGIRAIWSRDDGNDHHAVSTWTTPEPVTHAYSADQIGSVDVGFCEKSGIGRPPDVLGVCCICSGACTEDMTQKDCVQNLRGVWTACADCSNPSICPGVPVNDECTSPLVITGIPTDGSELVIEGNNFCATDDGPGLMGGEGGCAGSLAGGADLGNDVWYSYVAEACGELTVDSCFDADFDQMIAVYDATNGCPLSTGDEIGCGDDTCGIGAGPSRVTVLVFENEELLIRVGGWRNEFARGFSTDNSRGKFILRFSFDGHCPPCVSPTAPEPPHDWRKNRYISITPNPCDPPLGEGDIRITLADTLVNGVTAVGSSWWATAPDANCISIVSSTRPATAPNWSECPTLHLTGCPIIPTSTYHIATLSGGFVSDPPFVAETQRLPADNKWWGDAVGHFTGSEGTPPNVWTAPQGVTNFDDVTACLKTFLDPNAANATHTSITDIHPLRPDLGGAEFHPNKIVNANDIFQFIQAFQGAEYPGPRIELCP